MLEEKNKALKIFKYLFETGKHKFTDLKSEDQESEIIFSKKFDPLYIHDPSIPIINYVTILYLTNQSDRADLISEKYLKNYDIKSPWMKYIMELKNQKNSFFEVQTKILKNKNRRDIKNESTEK